MIPYGMYVPVVVRLVEKCYFTYFFSLMPETSGGIAALLVMHFELFRSETAFLPDVSISSSVY